jgi:multiple sugar transport system ATP-binding protein
MSTVTLTDVSHRYPSTVTPSVIGVTLHVLDGEFFVLLGPSGSGKSTLLRMIHGMERPFEGTVAIDGQDVSNSRPSDRDVMLAFENYALYPHMTVAENMGFALRLTGLDQDEINRRVRSAAAQLGLTEVLDARNEELDGLQRQKVALARALVRKPKVFVMDEPLAHLPQDVRDTTRDQIRSMQQDLGITTLYATASLEDARAVADHIAVLDDGRLLGVFAPDQFSQLAELVPEPEAT